jgi:hypothetical protein
MGKSFPANIPPCTCKKSGLELGLAQDGGLLGNLGGQARPGKLIGSKLPVWQWGKHYLREGILKENLEAAGVSVKEVLRFTYVRSKDGRLNDKRSNDRRPKDKRSNDKRK